MTDQAEVDAPPHRVITIRVTPVGNDFIERYRELRRQEGVGLSINSAIQELISLGYQAAVDVRKAR